MSMHYTANVLRSVYSVNIRVVCGLLFSGM